MIITHYFDWQDTFTEYCISKQFDSELFDFNVDKRMGLISNFVCLWPLCTHWDLSSIFICLHIYNLQVTLDIMNTWFCCLLSFIKSILSPENLNSQWSWSSFPLRKMSIIQYFKEDSWPLFYSLTLCLRCMEAASYWGLCSLFHWDHGTSVSAHRPRLTGGNLSPSLRVSPNIPGDRDQLPGARCSHQRLRGARGAATNIRMSLQPMFTVSPARYNHISIEISKVI